MVLVAGVAVAATLAPLLDIFTALVCEELKPELLTVSAVQFHNESWPTIPIPSKMCRQDPTVQKEVARLVTGIVFFDRISGMPVLTLESNGYRYGCVIVSYGRLLDAGMVWYRRSFVISAC